MKIVIIMIIILYTMVGSALAGEADVLDVDVVKTGTGTFSFSVTVKHDDSGWEHYADKWDIVGPDNAILGTRTLYHPHVDEQPFTRRLGKVSVGASIQQVSVKAHCSVHGYGGKYVAVRLPH